MEKAGTPVIVVDTNVISYHWMASPHSGLADKAFAKDPDWIAPLLWRSEFRNVLNQAVRRNLIPTETAIDIAEKAELQFAGREFIVSARTVLRLTSKSRCSAYDCEFVGLAEAQRVPLLTGDPQILHDFPRWQRRSKHLFNKVFYVKPTS
jgi:predicted nucleic acid-binding protein